MFLQLGWKIVLGNSPVGGVFVSLFLRNKLFFSGRKKLLPQNALSVQDSFWVARFGCAKPLADYQCNRGTTNAN